MGFTSAGEYENILNIQSLVSQPPVGKKLCRDQNLLSEEQQ